EIEAREFFAALARPIDQAVDGRGASATFAAHDGGGLAGEGGEFYVAVGFIRDMPCEGGFPGAGVTEQAEDLRGPVQARCGPEPIGDGFESVLLVRRELGHWPQSHKGCNA